MTRIEPGRIGVAISTTGDEHRLPLLVRCVEAWDKALRNGDSLYVTVDGDQDAADRVALALDHWTGSVFRVGQNDQAREGRMGVAVSKNTGLELLMDNAHAQHAFLCDDDTWPLGYEALTEHTSLGLAHSMICWGMNRNPVEFVGTGYANWSWPRGVLLYVQPQILAEVGGMDERFGPGGHEHVEWSRRIYQARLTPVLFPTPALYVTRHGKGARVLWNCEDMKRPGESLEELGVRRKALTTLHKQRGDWTRINRIMEERDGDTSYVPFRAHQNGRSAATLTTHPSSHSAEGQSRGAQG